MVPIADREVVENEQAFGVVSRPVRLVLVEGLRLLVQRHDVQEQLLSQHGRPIDESARGEEPAVRILGGGTEGFELERTQPGTEGQEAAALRGDILNRQTDPGSHRLLLGPPLQSFGEFGVADRDFALAHLPVGEQLGAFQDLVEQSFRAVLRETQRGSVHQQFDHRPGGTDFQPVVVGGDLHSFRTLHRRHSVKPLGEQRGGSLLLEAVEPGRTDRKCQLGGDAVFQRRLPTRLDRRN